jgi:acyl dehydratase
MEIASRVATVRRVKVSKLVDTFTVRALAEILFGSDDGVSADAQPIPFMYPFCWFETPAIQRAIFDSIDLGRWAVFHEAQDFIYDGAFERGSFYDISIDVEDIDGSPRQLKISGSAIDAIGQEILRIRSMLRVVGLDSTFQATLAAPQRSNSAGLDDLLPVVGVYPIETARISRYLVITGDDNPIHHDMAVARAAGLDSPIIPGMFVLGLFERAIRDWRADVEIKRVNGRFLSPVCIPADVTIRRRVVRSVPSQGCVETVLRLCAGTQTNPMACVADALVRCSMS